MFQLKTGRYVQEVQFQDEREPKCNSDFEERGEKQDGQDSKPLRNTNGSWPERSNSTRSLGGDLTPFHNLLLMSRGLPSVWTYWKDLIDLKSWCFPRVKHSYLVEKFAFRVIQHVSFQMQCSSLERVPVKDAFSYLARSVFVISWNPNCARQLTLDIVIRLL